MSQRYDVFISFKHLDDQGRPTVDAALARAVHDFLSARGLRVFLSIVSLEKLGISAYKKSIDNALDTAQVLVAVGTSAANLDSEWVRYEWDSFFSDVLSGVNPEARVFVYTNGVALKDLPRTLRQSQVINHAPGSLELLSNFITNSLAKEPTKDPFTATPTALASSLGNTDGAQSRTGEAGGLSGRVTDLSGTTLSVNNLTFNSASNAEEQYLWIWEGLAKMRAGFMSVARIVVLANTPRGNDAFDKERGWIINIRIEYRDGTAHEEVAGVFTIRGRTTSNREYEMSCYQIREISLDPQ